MYRDTGRLLALCVILLCPSAFGDGFAVGRVYHPYVSPLERELEWRAVIRDEAPDAPGVRQSHRLGYGQSLGSRWFGEIYLTGEQGGGESLSVDAFEAELLRQLTLQGEYWADWGLLLELERERGEDAWEASAGLLVEKEWGRWSTTVNLHLIGEWGGDIDNELENRLALQTRYRYSPALEPALELHSGEDTLAAGPVLLGDARLGGRRNLHWELGVFAGLDQRTPDRSLRATLEYEF